MYAIPALVIYLLFIILPSLKTIINIFADINSLDILENVAFIKAFKNTILVCSLSFVFQAVASLLLANLMLKSRENIFFTQVFLVFSFIPLTVLTLSWIYFFKYDTLVLAHINEALNINIGRLALNNNFFSIVIVALLSALQWIGFHGIIIYYFIKSIPEKVYDIAKIDGLEGFSLLSHLVFPIMGTMLGVSFFAMIASSVKIFEAAFVFQIHGGSGENLFTLWNKLYIQGNFQESNVVAVLIMISILFFTGLLLICKRFLGRVNYN